MNHKLEVQHLKINFRTQSGKVQAVRDISFNLDNEETLCIVGESGSGKSVTAKAVMGLLAGNSIVEGGKILYDGRDLLKISEEDFQSIRGDKIAMIFQDPMSSLDPMMRIGNQITDAMLLKNKRSRKHAHKNFEDKLNNLRYYLNLVYPEDYDKNRDDCFLFRDFTLYGTRLELAFRTAKEQAHETTVLIDKTVFLLEKDEPVDIRKVGSDIQHKLTRSKNPFFHLSETSCSNFISRLGEMKKNEDRSAFASLLKEIKETLKAPLEEEEPNFFRIGYYLHKEKNVSVAMPTAELNKIALESVNTFLLEFAKRVEKAFAYQFDECYEKKSTLCDELAQNIASIQKMEPLDRKALLEMNKELSAKVRDTIQCLDIYKNSTEYTFRTAFENAIETYFLGVKNNPVNMKKYEKMKNQYDALVKKGKTPSWSVIPPSITDLELQKQNIIDILQSLLENYQEEMKEKETYNAYQDAVDFIDYLKEQGSTMVSYLNKQMAQEKAIRLLEEVGIADPETRFRQYPFEFSGGMRQRIVIAIALSANPDILICDEPTTALDVTIQSQIMELINRIKKERHLSIIFITHDLGVVANMADRVAVMYAGKFVEYGTVRDIFYDPRHPYTWALLSSMPDLDTKEELEAIPGTPPNMIYPPKGDAFAERNKYALEIDFMEEPPMFEISETHYAATWLLHPNAPKVEIPKVVTERIERMRRRTNHGK